MDLLDHLISQLLAERVMQNRFGLDFGQFRQEVAQRNTRGQLASHILRQLRLIEILEQRFSPHQGCVAKMSESIAQREQNRHFIATRTNVFTVDREKTSRSAFSRVMRLLTA
jgi:hypothetical protein